MRTTGLELTRHYSSNKQDLLQGCPTWDITAPRLVLLVNCGLWDTGKPSILTFSNLSKRKLADPSEGTLHLLLKTGSYLQPFKLYWKNFGWTFFILITSLISRWATISPPPSSNQHASKSFFWLRPSIFTGIFITKARTTGPQKHCKTSTTEARPAHRLLNTINRWCKSQTTCCKRAHTEAGFRKREARRKKAPRRNLSQTWAGAQETGRAGYKGPWMRPSMRRPCAAGETKWSDERNRSPSCRAGEEAAAGARPAGLLPRPGGGGGGAAAARSPGRAHAAPPPGPSAAGSARRPPPTMGRVVAAREGPAAAARWPASAHRAPRRAVAPAARETTR